MKYLFLDLEDFADLWSFLSLDEDLSFDLVLLSLLRFDLSGNEDTNFVDFFTLILPGGNRNRNDNQP